MPSLDDTTRLQSPALDVIKVIASHAAVNGPVQSADYIIRRVMEDVQRGTLEKTSYSRPRDGLWYMLNDTSRIVALFPTDKLVFYLTQEVQWPGCPEAGRGVVKEIITPAQAALSYCWGENIVLVQHPEGSFWCHPFRLQPSTII